MKNIDHSPYAVAHRLDEALSVIEEQKRRLDNAFLALESLLFVQQKILDRLEILEKSANTLHLKRTPKNE